MEKTRMSTYHPPSLLHATEPKRILLGGPRRLKTSTPLTPNANNRCFSFIDEIILNDDRSVKVSIIPKWGKMPSSTRHTIESLDCFFFKLMSMMFVKFFTWKGKAPKVREMKEKSWKIRSLKFFSTFVHGVSGCKCQHRYKKHHEQSYIIVRLDEHHNFKSKFLRLKNLSFNSNKKNWESLL